MKKLIMILSVVLMLQACHYSCFNCTGPQYISCLSCPNGTTISVVEDPNTTPAAYWSSVYQTGTCVDTTAVKTNALGILLFIILSVSCVVIGTKESFYLFLTIQTFGLYNLVEIAWVNPLGYLLQAMQYLMIWNIIGAGYKSADYIFTSNKYYRLNTFLRQTEIGQNILLIAIFTIIAMVLLIVICLVAVHRKKQQEKKEEKEEEQKGEVIFQNFQPQPEKPEGPTCMERFSEKVLIQVAKFLLSVLYLMAQQTSLVLLVSLVFRLNKVIIILSIIYLHILIFTMSYAYYYRVEYFKQKNVMYINFAKKVVLPIMVVVPLRYQFLFFLFAAVIIVVELLIDCYNGLYKKFNRLAFYKVLELLIVVLLIIYYLVEQTGGKYSSSRAAAIACTFVIAFYLFVFVAVEVPIGIKERFFSKKNNRKDQLMLEDKNATQEFFVENLKEKNSNSRGQKDDNFQVVEMNSSKSQGSQDQEANHQPQEKISKDDNTSVKQSIAENKPEETAKPQPAKKKRRKQILDKQLRMRYGI